MSVQLTFKSPAGDRTVRLDSTLTVGRDPGCDVCIETVRLSRRHAEFRLTDDGGVVVKDLGSRNGVMLNGTRVDEAHVDPGARILLGDVAVTLSGARKATALNLPPVDTAGVDSGTRRMTPLERSRPVVPPMAPARAVESDKTTMLPRAMADAMRNPAAAPLAVPPAPAIDPHTSSPATAHARPPKVAFAGKLAAVCIAASLGLFLVTAVPLVIAVRQQLSSEATAHAATLVNLLLDDNRATLSAGQRFGVTTRGTASEPGVRGTLLVTPEGQVLAPSERLNETVSSLSAFGPLSSITGPATASVDGQFEAVGVMTVGGRRAAIAWVAYDPRYARGGQTSLPFVLAADLLVAIGVGIFLAVTMRRMVATRLEALAVDIELAASGRLATMTSRYDLPSLERSIESLNYLIRRGGAAGAFSPGEPFAAAQPATASAAPAPRPASRSAALAGSLTLDAAFVVRDADDGAGDLLGAGAQTLIGRHVLEVTAEQGVLDAIIDGLSALGEGASAERDVTGGTPLRRIRVEKRGADIILTLQGT